MTRTTGRAIDLVVLHTAEVEEREGAALAIARWFARPEARVSAHYCVDAHSVVQCVRERDVAWHARGANARSIGIELAGVAAQSESEWQDEYSMAVLERAAGLAARICARHGVPLVWLRAAQLRVGARGLTGHAEVSRAFGLSDHWDPGPGFPVRRFLALLRSRHELEPGVSPGRGARVPS